jgi:Rod binding domain-containing protein
MSTGRVGGPSGTDPGGLLESLRAGEIRGEAAKLRAASTLLESAFVQELYKVMRETVPEGGITSGGSGEAIFSGMLDQHVAEVTAGDMERGLGRALYDQLRGAAGIPEEGDVS